MAGLGLNPKKLHGVSQRQLSPVEVIYRAVADFHLDLNLTLIGGRVAPFVSPKIGHYNFGTPSLGLLVATRPRSTRLWN